MSFEEFQNKRLEWAHLLSLALTRWFQQNGYRQKKLLAEDLGISRRDMDTALAGKGIASDTSVYAKILLWTDLSEADPTTVPSRPVKNPTSDKIGLKPQAWSTTRHKQWLSSSEAKDLAAKKLQKWPEKAADEVEEKHEPTTDMPPMGFLPVTVGGWIDLLINALAEQVASQVEARNAILFERLEEVIRLLKQQGQLQIDLPQAGVDQLAKAMLVALKPTINGSSKDRDRFLIQHGEEIKRLFIVLEVLTDEPESRERIIPTLQREGV